MSIKIISGRYKGRTLPIVGQTRPPLMRIRSSIFDLIQVIGLTVLDLCAGTGSLGLESISRGAKEVFFFEENRITAQNLMKTLLDWKLTNAYVAISNVEYLPQAKVQVDLVFFDPPFGHQNIERVSSRVIQKGWTHKETILVLRTDHKQTKLDGWKSYDLRKCGISYIGFWRPDYAD